MKELNLRDGIIQLIPEHTSDAYTFPAQLLTKIDSIEVCVDLDRDELDALIEALKELKDKSNSNKNMKDLNLGDAIIRLIPEDTSDPCEFPAQLLIENDSNEVTVDLDRIELDALIEALEELKDKANNNKNTSKKKLYIILPISESSLDEDVLKAESHKRRLEEDGYDVVTPFDVCMEKGKPHSYYMGKDIEALLECDAIFLDSDWRNSKRCVTEYMIAGIYAKEVITTEWNILHEQCKDGAEQISKMFNGLTKQE